MNSFASALPIVRASSAAFRPPRRVTVAEGAAESLVIRQPGGYSGNWSPNETPYMIEPMNMLASRGHEAVCFVGPSRTGKTMGLLDGWLAHCITNDPGDMLITQMSQDKAREFSKTRVDRAVRNSPRLRELMSLRGHDDNTHDKLFRHGMWVKIGWPSASQLSSSDYRYVALTDYDRMPDDIDGEGSAYQLGLKRTQTFQSRGMLMVESSPGRDVTDPKWRPTSPHEAPPCTGILGVYNRSDRRRWYWQCPDCSEYFEAKPGIGLFSSLPADDELVGMVRALDLSAFARDHAKVACPHCGSIIEQRWKPHLNNPATARWLADGQTITRDREISGHSPVSSIAGFWLGGVAAAYQNWESLLLRYLQGLREYAMSGSDLTLKATVNTEQGMPYLPRYLAAASKTAFSSERTSSHAWHRVPPQARFIVAAADVQAGKNPRFVVQVHAVGEHLEQWLIDRYEIRKSLRTDVAGEKMPINPAAYPEDWDVLTKIVAATTYRIDGEREMRVRILVVDTGGEDGVTGNAYSWLRRTRDAGYAHRAMLIKGGSHKSEKIVRVSMVGADDGITKPDIPLHLLDTDKLKDMVFGSLDRDGGGPGAIHFPKGLPESFFDELTAEVRGPDGKWKKLSRRNEALDLCAYIRAGCIQLGADRFNWGALPSHCNWALPIDAGNADVITSEARRAMQAALSRAQAAPHRRVARSNYLKNRR